MKKKSQSLRFCACVLFLAAAQLRTGIRASARGNKKKNRQALKKGLALSIFYKKVRRKSPPKKFESAWWRIKRQFLVLQSLIPNQN